MALVDTNILAYLLIEGEHTPAARALAARDPVWESESYVLIEFANILARYFATEALTWDQVRTLFVTAQNLMTPSLHTVSHIESLEVATEFKISAYDARFLLLARTLGRKLVTEDKKLRATAPELTQSLQDALANT